jgi:hypothetical protein
MGGTARAPVRNSRAKLQCKRPSGEIGGSVSTIVAVPVIGDLAHAVPMRRSAPTRLTDGGSGGRGLCRDVEAVRLRPRPSCAASRENMVGFTVRLKSRERAAMRLSGRSRGQLRSRSAASWSRRACWFDASRAHATRLAFQASRAHPRSLADGGHCSAAVRERIVCVMLRPVGSPGPQRVQLALTAVVSWWERGHKTFTSTSSSRCSVAARDRIVSRHSRRRPGPSAAKDAGAAPVTPNPGSSGS